MSELIPILIGMAIGAGVAGIVTYLFYRQRLLALRYTFIAARTRDQRDAAESVDRMVREGENAFSVRVEPFVRKVSESGLFSKVRL